MHDASKDVNSPRRIAVIGRAGAGKTTVSLRLGQALDLPVVHLDRLYWGPSWGPVDGELFAARQAAAVAGEAWVIDGGYLSARGWEERLRRADVVVLVEAPLLVCLWRVLRRPLSRGASRRPDLPDGCDEALSLFFLRWTIEWKGRHRDLIAELKRTDAIVVMSGRGRADRIP